MPGRTYIKQYAIILILLGAFLVRLYGFANPIADWHSWRQADTSAVSRNFIKHGFDVLHPQFDDLSNVPSGKNNPHGYRFVEFPIYNLFQAGLYITFGIFTLEQWGRLVSIISSLFAILFLYLLVARYTTKNTGMFVAFFYAFTPYNIFYGQTILPDQSMIMAVLGGLYFFDKALHKKKNSIGWKDFSLSIIFTASALLLKPYALFYGLVFFFIAWKRFGAALFTKWYLWVFFLMILAPLSIWRIWMLQYPEGIASNTWLFNGDGIRFRPAFFRWILFERITKLISGYFGILLLVIGFISSFSLKNRELFYAFLLGSASYVVILATGNVRHDYYQIIIMPVIALGYGLGATYLYNLKKNMHLLPVGKVILGIVTIGMFFCSWNMVKDYFNINNRAIVVAGKAVDRLLPKDAKIMALYGGDTSFLYQTNRQGWASFQHDIPEMVKLGAQYIVLVNPTKDDYNLAKDYKIVAQAKEYLIIDITKKP